MGDPKHSAPRAFLISVQCSDETSEQAQASLKELESLASTLDVMTVGYTIQARTQPHPRTYIGSGKVKEAHEQLKMLEGNLVIVNANLSPKQSTNLSKELQCEVFDRTQLILKIFEQNAKTHEAKLQVEIASLQYMLPRLVRLWTHLDRERGGGVGKVVDGSCYCGFSSACTFILHQYCCRCVLHETFV